MVYIIVSGLGQACVEFMGECGYNTVCCEPVCVGFACVASSACVGALGCDAPLTAGWARPAPLTLRR